MAVTQLGESATPGRRMGSFASKPAGSTHQVGKIIQLALSGVSGRRYGAFTGRGGGATATSSAFYLFGEQVLR